MCGNEFLLSSTQHDQKLVEHIVVDELLLQHFNEFCCDGGFVRRGLLEKICMKLIDQGIQ